MKNLTNCKVLLGKKSYTIFIGKDILGSVPSYIPNYEKYSKIILITDENVYQNNQSLLT